MSAQGRKMTCTDMLLFYVSGLTQNRDGDMIVLFDDQARKDRNRFKEQDRYAET